MVEQNTALTFWVVTMTKTETLFAERQLHRQTRTKTNCSPMMSQTCRGQKTAMNLSQEIAERVRTLETTQTTV